MSEAAVALQSDPRETEYKVFDRVTKALSSSKDNALKAMSTPPVLTVQFPRIGADGIGIKFRRLN